MICKNCGKDVPSLDKRKSWCWECNSRATDRPPLTTVQVSTRHPQDYELLNHEDGSRWVIRDGTWKRAPDPETSPPDDGWLSPDCDGQHEGRAHNYPETSPPEPTAISSSPIGPPEHDAKFFGSPRPPATSPPDDVSVSLPRYHWTQVIDTLTDQGWSTIARDIESQVDGNFLR
jgi:hypothetical protein